jgi:hypothetical protein
MTRRPLRDANRAVLDAIATPPDTGVEADLDRIASHLYYLAEEKPLAPDHGRLSLLRQKLRELEQSAHPDRAGRLEHARERLLEYQRDLAPTSTPRTHRPAD